MDQSKSKDAGVGRAQPITLMLKFTILVKLQGAKISVTMLGVQACESFLV